MSKTTSRTIKGKSLVNKVICPNCWHSFLPEEVLFVSKHPDLIGDNVAGENEYQRFLPNRFTVDGQAIDPRGSPTSDLACPRCHLQVPEVMLEVPPLFISFAGAPASGKSYFLTTMTWELRRLMPQIGLMFTDADPVANSHIQTNEHILFMNPLSHKPTDIPKTQTDDPLLHKTVLLDGSPTRYPVPLQFTLWPTPEHVLYKKAHGIEKVLVLYDNAGEDFLPGIDDSNSAVVQHLAKSKIMFMLFDPIQDPRFRDQCKKDDPQIRYGARPGVEGTSGLIRQEILLREMAVRIRRYLKISQSDRIKNPLIIILAKFDMWEDITDISIDEEPYTTPTKDSRFKMDVARIEKTSKTLEDLMKKLCPEFVATAEDLSEIVRYIPVSSLGHSPALIETSEKVFYGVRPENIKPKWVTVPLLYTLYKYAPKTMGNLSRSR